MRNQFIVPQFIEVESKIIGPISGRQFVIMLVAAGLSYIEFSLFQSPTVFLPLVLITLGIGGILAFIKVNGQSMHYVLLNLFQTAKKPSIRVWRREMSHEKQLKVDEFVPQAPQPKVRASQSHLAEMALLVDTGGVYQGDVEETTNSASK